MVIPVTEHTSDLEATLASYGIMPTPQRLDIAGLMLAKDQHLSADQVLEKLQARGNSVSKATVYNTLGLFARKGLLREVIIDPTRTFYDSNTRPHHHFYNIDNGQLADFDPQAVAIERLPALPEGTEACGVEVIVRVRNSRG